MIGIETLLNKLSSYELVNYIFLGGLGLILGIFLKVNFFVNIMEILNSLEIILQTVSYIIFVYFLGILISRIGSFLEIVFKRDHNCSKIFIQYSTYIDYIKAEKVDPKISILSLQANLYRSLFGLFVILIVLSILENYFSILFSGYILEYLVLFILLIIFYFSWRKQVEYVRKRVENVNRGTLE